MDGKYMPCSVGIYFRVLNCCELDTTIFRTMVFQTYPTSDLLELLLYRASSMLNSVSLSSSKSSTYHTRKRAMTRAISTASKMYRNTSWAMR